MIDFQRHHQIYHLLSLSKTPLSSQEIADYMNVSIRTIKDDMSKVEKFALENGSKLHSKRGTGYWLEIIDSALFSHSFFQLKIRNAYSTDLKRISNNFETIDVMQFIISQPSYFKIEEIAAQFYIPKNLVSEVIKSLKSLLNSYNLKYITRSNYGNIIVGDEFKKRIAMLMLFDIHFHKVEMDRTVESFYQFFESDQDELAKTRLVLLSTLRKYHYHIHDDYSQCLSRYLVLAKKRNKAGYTLELAEQDKQLLRKFHLPLQVATDIFDSLQWVDHTSYSEDDILTLVLLLLLWSDYVLSDTMRDLHQPIEEELDEMVVSFLKIVETKFNSVRHGFDYLKPFLKRKLAPLLLHQKFGCSKFDIKGGNFIDRRKLTPLGMTFIHLFEQFMLSQYQSEFSNYLLQKFALDLSNYILRFPLYEPINLLIASVEGIEGALYIEHRLKELYNPKLFNHIEAIELYEGRSIPTEEFDFMILDSLDTMFYAYEWPVYSLKPNFSHVDLHFLMDIIYELAHEKKRLSSPFLQSISCENKIVHPSKLKAMVAQRAKYDVFSFNQTLYYFDTSLPLNTCVLYKSQTKNQIQSSQIKSILHLNIQIFSYEELALFNAWLNKVN